MDLISLSRDAWRHKLVTIPIVALTFLLAVWVLAIRPATYIATASYTLVPPPACPTQSQILASPKLANVDCNNPYVSYGNMTVVVDVLAQAMTDPAVKQELDAKGVTGSYTIDTSDASTAPIINISTTGASPAAATASATITANLTLHTLAELQDQQRVVSTYQITAQQLNAPNHPTAKLSSKIRDFIAIIAVGVLGWFIALSIAKGLAEQRELRASSRKLRRADERSESPRARGGSADVASAARARGSSAEVVSAARNLVTAARTMKPDGATLAAADASRSGDPTR